MKKHIHIIIIFLSIISGPCFASESDTLSLRQIGDHIAKGSLEKSVPVKSNDLYRIDHDYEVNNNHWDSNKLFSTFYWLPKKYYSHGKTLPQTYVVNHLHLECAEKNGFNLDENPAIDEVKSFSTICADSIPCFDDKSQNRMNTKKFEESFNNPPFSGDDYFAMNRFDKQPNSLSILTYQPGKNESFKNPHAFASHLKKHHAILQTQSQRLNDQMQQLEKEKFSKKSLLGLPLIAGFCSASATWMANNFLGLTVNPLKVGISGSTAIAARLLRHNNSKEHEKAKIHQHIKVNNNTSMMLFELIHNVARFDKRITKVGTYSMLAQSYGPSKINTIPTADID